MVNVSAITKFINASSDYDKKSFLIMNILENITIEIAEKISKASLNKTTKPTILFCGCNPHIKKDMHKRAKRIGLNPSYSIKHPTLKVELKNNRKIETDTYRTITIGYEHFEFIYRTLNSKKYR